MQKFCARVKEKRAREKSVQQCVVFPASFSSGSNLYYTRLSVTAIAKLVTNAGYQCESDCSEISEYKSDQLSRSASMDF